MSARRKLTRGDREELEETFGETFSTNLAETYVRMSEEDQEEVRGMSTRDAKKTLLKARRDDAEKINKAVAEAEPAWLTEQKNSPPAETDRRTFTGPGVVDTGKGSVLINPPSAVGKDGKDGEDGVGGGVVAADPCPFGDIITIPDSDPAETGIRGGVIYCGDQNWNMDPDPINLAVAGVWLVSIEVELEVNRDDAEEVILPGILTGTQPTGAWTRTAWTVGTNYPANISPDASTGTGTINIPLGKLTVTSGGTATLEKTGCGNIHISHCAGTLEHIRSNDAPPEIPG